MALPYLSRIRLVSSAPERNCPSRNRARSVKRPPVWGYERPWRRSRPGAANSTLPEVRRFRCSRNCRKRGTCVTSHECSSVTCVTSVTSVASVFRDRFATRGVRLLVTSRGFAVQCPFPTRVSNERVRSRTSSKPRGKSPSRQSMSRDRQGCASVATCSHEVREL